MQYILNETEYQAFVALKEENAKLSHKLAVASKAREMDRRQIEELSHVRDLDNKKLAEQAHELLCKEAELADLSSKLKEVMRDCEGTSKVLAATQKISAERLALVNNLLELVRHLKAEKVCIAHNPKTGTVKVVSVVKADTYRKFGWTVSEEYLVDRPA